MGLESGYPVVIGAEGVPQVVVYDGNFQPIDAFPGGGYHVNITCQTTGPDQVEYYRLLASEWENNTTNQAYVRVADVQITDNPWGEIPRCSDLSGCLKAVLGGAAVAGAVGAAGLAIRKRRSKRADVDDS